MSETVGATFGASASGPRPGRRGRVVNSLLWSIAVVVGLGVAAVLTQIGTWGLWFGVVLVLVVLGGAAVLLGMVWRRGVLAAMVCVVGFAAMLFAGPAAYEQYMRAFGEPMPAVVVDVHEPDERADLNSRRCVVVDDAGTVHRLDQRQNCFDHIRAERSVTIYRDPLGMLPPRLEDSADRGSVAAVTTVVAGILLAVTGAVVLGGGILRRSASLWVPPVNEDHSDDDLDQKGYDDAPAETGRVLWLEQRRAPRGGPDAVPPDQPSAGGDAVWEVRATDARVQVAEHADIDVLAYLESPTPARAAGDSEPSGGYGFGSVVLWADAGRREVFARVVPESSPSRRTVRYAVTGRQGASLASVTCRTAVRFSLRRARWIVERSGQPAAVGYQGRPLSRLVRCVTAPLRLLVFVISVIVLDPIALKRRPPGITWRVGRKVALEYRVGRAGSADHAGRLHVHDAQWDPRVAAALVALL